MKVLAILIAGLLAQDSPTLTIADVSPKDGVDPAMGLAPRLLPPEVLPRVVAGKVQRSLMLSQFYSILYREQARPAGADLCEFRAYGIVAADPKVSGDNLSPSTPLPLQPLERWTEVAVLPPGETATEKNCVAAKGFIRRGPVPERNVAAYRVLVSAMAVARGRGALPFKVTCREDDPPKAACAEPRAALATLPMDVLYGISASCLDAQRYREGSFVKCVPLKSGDPYKAEVSFGMSAPDGRSWRAEFVHRAGWPDEIALRRSMVIYH